MPRKLFRPLLTLAVLACAPIAQGALEVSLTVSGDIQEIQALLNFIEQRNREEGESGANPLRINVHSIAEGGVAMESKPAPVPVKLSPPQLSAEKLTPGESTLVTVAARDPRNEVDTVAIQVVGTNLKTDLYDDGSHGDVVADDNVWSVTLTPMESTPAGTYEAVVTGFDRNGHAILVPGSDGEEIPVEARAEVVIQR